MNLSALEEWVVDALLRRVRVLAFLQIEKYCRIRTYQQSADQAIRKLSRLGLVESFTFSSVVLELQVPLAVWSAEDVSPDNFSKIAWQAKSRFLNAETREHRIFIATKAAASIFGGIGGSLRQPNQIMHDLGTASVYLAKQHEQSGTGTAWTGEDVLRRSWRHLGIRKVPDAAHIANEQMVHVIEFAGRDYGRAYLEKFHQYWQRRKTSYEIW